MRGGNKGKSLYNKLVDKVNFFSDCFIDICNLQKILKSPN